MEKNQNHCSNKDKFLLLKNYVSMLQATRTDYEYFKMLVVKIIPLIRLLYPHLVIQWEKSKANYAKHCKQQTPATTAVYNLNAVKKSWVAWDYLEIAEWSWNDQYDFFKKKKLASNSKQGKKKNWRRGLSLLGMKMFRDEMLAIQKKQQGAYKIITTEDGAIKIERLRQVHVFVRERFDGFLELVIAKIYNDSIGLFRHSKPMFPRSFELVVANHRHLLLEVEWIIGVIEVFILHSFHDVIDEEVSPIELLGQTAIKGEIGKLFSLVKAQKVLFDVALNVNLKKILAQIQSFKNANTHQYIELINNGCWYLKHNAR